jgi:hypothetical protein
LGPTEETIVFRPDLHPDEREHHARNRRETRGFVLDYVMWAVISILLIVWLALEAEGRPSARLVGRMIRFVLETLS